MYVENLQAYIITKLYVQTYTSKCTTYSECIRSKLTILSTPGVSSFTSTMPFSCMSSRNRDNCDSNCNEILNFKQYICTSECIPSYRTISLHQDSILRDYNKICMYMYNIKTVHNLVEHQLSDPTGQHSTKNRSDKETVWIRK